MNDQHIYIKQPILTHNIMMVETIMNFLSEIIVHCSLCDTIVVIYALHRRHYFYFFHAFISLNVNYDLLQMCIVLINGLQIK